MQNSYDWEEVRGVESSSGRTDQSSPQLHDRTWDASYGIVFGSPGPTQQGQPLQPRTFEMSPSSQFKFFSASSTASLLVRPLQRSTTSSTTNRRLKPEDRNTFASLALKPLENQRKVRIQNPGEAAAGLDAPKARLLSVSSELVDIPRRAQEDGVKSIVWNGGLTLLRRFRTLFESLNQVAETLEEHTQLTWISEDVKDMESRRWQSYGGMGNNSFKLGGVLPDVWPSTQGLCSLSRHHEKETKNTVLWKNELKQSMGCPKTLSLDATKPSTFRESIEASIQGGGLSSFEDGFVKPTHHDDRLPTTPPGSLSYLRDLGAKATYWDYTQYIGPKNGRVRVHYCASRETTERVIQKYFMDEEVIGFDMEWKANSSSSDSVKDNVSLIQVASEQRIGLFHIARYEKDNVLEDLVAPALRTLMESSTVIKTGVNIKADCTRLRKHLGIESRGLFELSHLFKLVKYAELDPTLVDRRPVKMSYQVEEHLGLPLWKGDVRTSNWAEKLGNEQILYAASDPYACLHLFDVLESKRKAMVPRPPRPEFAELNKPILLTNGQSTRAFKKTIDATEVVESEEAEEINQDIVSSSLDSGTIQRLESTVRDEAMGGGYVRHVNHNRSAFWKGRIFVLWVGRL